MALTRPVHLRLANSALIGAVLTFAVAAACHLNPAKNWTPGPPFQGPFPDDVPPGWTCMERTSNRRGCDGYFRYTYQI